MAIGKSFVVPAQCFAFRTFACSVLRTLNPQKFDYGLRPSLRMTHSLIVPPLRACAYKVSQLHHSHEVRTSLVPRTNFTLHSRRLAPLREGGCRRQGGARACSRTQTAYEPHRTRKLLPSFSSKMPPPSRREAWVRTTITRLRPAQTFHTRSVFHALVHFTNPARDLFHCAARFAPRHRLAASNACDGT